MRKCLKCNIVFQSSERSRCLYCDTMLMTVHEAEVPSDFGIAADQIVLAQLVRDRGRMGHGRKQYIIGSYFRTRNFPFIYSFSRYEYKMGKTWTRAFVQPPNIGFFLMLPWGLINILDSLYLQMTHTGYCEKCQCKYAPRGGTIGHWEEECLYNKEYVAIVKEILSGHITQTEEQYQQLALAKLKQGKHSAYYDLCSGRKPIVAFLDIMTILFSILLILAALLLASWPGITALINHAQAVAEQEEQRLYED